MANPRAKPGSLRSTHTLGKLAVEYVDSGIAVGDLPVQLRDPGIEIPGDLAEPLPVHRASGLDHALGERVGEAPRDHGRGVAHRQLQHSGCAERTGRDMLCDLFRAAASDTGLGERLLDLVRARGDRAGCIADHRGARAGLRILSVQHQPRRRRVRRDVAPVKEGRRADARHQHERYQPPMLEEDPAPCLVQLHIDLTFLMSAELGRPAAT